MPLSPEMQDTLDLMAEQRNAAQNAWVNVAAQLKAEQRKVAELEAKVAELSKPAAAHEFPISNGHIEEATILS